MASWETGKSIKTPGGRMRPGCLLENITSNSRQSSVGGERYGFPLEFNGIQVRRDLFGQRPELN